jgi:hypothetical protein
MNTIDDRISAALHARADSLTEDDLSPAAPPRGGRVPSQRGPWTVPLLAAAVAGIAVVATITAVQASRSDHAGPVTPPVGSVQPSPSGVGPTPVQSATNPAPSQSASRPSSSQLVNQPPVTTQSATQPAPSQSAPSQSAPSQSTPSQSTTVPQPFILGYQPLWPFNSYSEAEQWRVTPGGHQPWHLDAGDTALSFTRSYLGFTELDQVTGSRKDKLGAHVGVGYRDPNGRLRTSATLHLVRYGDAKDSPWEVVGSDDTTFSLEQPAYGSQVSSPMMVGGHITGVDESIVLSVLRSTSNGTDRTTLAGVPSGGDHAPWAISVPFTQRGVLTIVASTGGHLQQVERFAIQGVHT